MKTLIEKALEEPVPKDRPPMIHMRLPDGSTASPKMVKDENGNWVMKNPKFFERATFPQREEQSGKKVK